MSSLWCHHLLLQIPCGSAWRVGRPRVGGDEFIVLYAWVVRQLLWASTFLCSHLRAHPCCRWGGRISRPQTSKSIPRDQHCVSDGWGSKSIEPATFCSRHGCRSVGSVLHSPSGHVQGIAWHCVCVRACVCVCMRVRVCAAKKAFAYECQS